MHIRLKIYRKTNKIVTLEYLRLFVENMDYTSLKIRKFIAKRET